MPRAFAHNEFDARYLSRVARERHLLSKFGETVNQPRSLLTNPRTFVVVLADDLPAATTSDSGVTWTLQSTNEAKVYARTPDDSEGFSQDPANTITALTLEGVDWDSSPLEVRVFNATTSIAPANKALLAIQDTSGDLYITFVPAAPIYRGISAATLTKGGSAANVDRYIPGTTTTSGTVDSVKNELATIASGKVVYYFDDGSGTLYVIAAECPLT